MSYTKVDIGIHLEKPKNWNPKNEIPFGEFEYIDLSSIDKDLNPTCKFTPKKAGDQKKNKFFVSEYKAVTVLLKNSKIFI